MHIHLAKPLHGWRALAGEIEIIVVGVLIALSAEQFAEFVHDRAQVSAWRGGAQRQLPTVRYLHGRAQCICALHQCQIGGAPPADRSLVRCPSGYRMSVLSRRSKLVRGRSTHMTRWSLRRRSPTSLMARRYSIRGSRCRRSTYTTMQKSNGRAGKSSRASADRHVLMMMQKKRRIDSFLPAPFTRTPSCA